MSNVQPFSLFWAGWKHRQLVYRLASRKIQARFRGSVLGLLWSLAQPLFLLSVYTFVFSFVFQARWDIQGGDRVQFALFLFSGLILYAIFSECINEAPGLLLANKVYIKQLIFPTEVLAWASLLTSLFTFVVNSLVLLAFYLVVLGIPPWSALLLPLVLVPVILLTLGMVWLLSSLGLFLRDVSQAVGVFTTALLFLSPIFYPSTSVPERFRPYFDLNPFVSILEMFRATLFYGVLPDWQRLTVLTLAGWGVAWLGYVFFMKTKRGFPDVL